jgi:hypothetical protein
MQRILQSSFGFLGVVLAIAALGQLVAADDALAYQCRRYCWLYTLLEPVLGSSGLRALKALIWAVFSGGCFAIAWQYRKRPHR